MVGTPTPNNTATVSSAAIFLEMVRRLPKVERNGTAKIKLMSIFNSNRSHQKLFSPKVVATDFLYQYLSVSVFYHLTGTGCITL